MKKLIIILFILFSASMVFATDYVDVVEKKDGSILKGIIIENRINDFIKIELVGGSVFKVPYSEIDTLKKEKNNNITSDGSIIINNSNNNAITNGGASTVTGYDHFELLSMLDGVSLRKLKKVNIDKGLMRNTDLSTRIAVYHSLEERDIVGYTILNILLPGVGSISQGDKGHGWFSLIASSLCTIIGYSLLYEYSMNSIESYDYYTGEYHNDVKEEYLVLGTAFLIASGGINISNWFAPSSYKKKYNKELKTTLMY